MGKERRGGIDKFQTQTKIEVGREMNPDKAKAKGINQ